MNAHPVARFEIRARRPERVPAFYSRLFGWPVERDSEDNLIGLIEPFRS